MQAVPLNVSKPLMSLDIFGIVWINIAASMILGLMLPRRLIVRFVPSGTQALILFLNDASNKILAPLTD